ncbi:hypothetical protein PMIN05_012312 [Paraphaeosphaeria minitans]
MQWLDAAGLGLLGVVGMWAKGQHAADDVLGAVALHVAALAVAVDAGKEDVRRTPRHVPVPGCLEQHHLPLVCRTRPVLDLDGRRRQCAVVVGLVRAHVVGGGLVDDRVGTATEPIRPVERSDLAAIRPAPHVTRRLQYVSLVGADVAFQYVEACAARVPRVQQVALCVVGNLDVQLLEGGGRGRVGRCIQGFEGRMGASTRPFRGQRAFRAGRPVGRRHGSSGGGGGGGGGGGDAGADDGDALLFFGHGSAAKAGVRRNIDACPAA